MLRTLSRKILTFSSWSWSVFSFLYCFDFVGLIDLVCYFCCHCCIALLKLFEGFDLASDRSIIACGLQIGHFFFNDPQHARSHIHFINACESNRPVTINLSLYGLLLAICLFLMLEVLLIFFKSQSSFLFAVMMKNGCFEPDDIEN